MSQTTPAMGSFEREPEFLVHLVTRLAVVFATIVLLQPIFVNDVAHYWDIGKNVAFDHLPYRDFLWEFPPLTTLVLFFVPISAHSHLLFHLYFIALAVTCEVLSMRLVLRLAAEKYRPMIGWYWLAVAVPLSAIAYYRFDWIATMFGVLALAGVLNNRTKTTAVGILGGYLVKVWTVVFVAILIGLKRFRQAALSVLLIAVVSGLWYLFSPQGVDDFLQYRKGSGFQIESIPGSLIMLFGSHESFFQYGALMVSDDGWKWVQPILPLMFVVFAGVSVLVMWKRSVDIVALSSALVLLLLLTSRLLSPQYLIWIVPFVALLLARHRLQGWLFALASLMTLVEIQFYGDVIDANLWASLLVVVRNVVLVVVLVQHVRLALRPEPAAATPAA